MNDYNIYGKNEIELVLVHGGPGARGSLKDLAIILSEHYGILEINQSKETINELIEDMHTIISETCKKEVILLGHSWGAWLICLFANKYPEKIKKLILVGSGSFDEKYVEEFNDRRLSRLDENDKEKYNVLMKAFMSEDTRNKDQIMSEFGSLMSKLDTFAFEGNEYSTTGTASFQMFNKIWGEASKLRKTGTLLSIMEKIDIPIHIIHGDYDSHEIKGILEPFDKKQIHYTYNLIPKCGHYPWREKYGKKEFFDIVHNEMKLE